MKKIKTLMGLINATATNRSVIVSGAFNDKPQSAMFIANMPARIVCAFLVTGMYLYPKKKNIKRK